MELRHLRYFVAVAEELHFGRAAARVRIAQPPLSQQIRQLEQELGVVLFNRNKRRVELTPAGRAFLEEVRRIFAQTAHAVRTAQRADRGEIGQLAIGFVPSADLDILPRVLRVWSSRFPAVEIELHTLRAIWSSNRSSASRWWRRCREGTTRPRAPECVWPTSRGMR